ncbi:IspD/TarI family cytidylyltransferase [Schauerella aestuarii]|uniref:IspD/TarI family cytidylyltransferase n=1 Tax=Schauerella aestuarii TaxID=2511204 RepID=UPI0013686175|nr:2-C-methyl-D-erythritol 4-phosphate cytidylyltransferase [Achromobacter aestuarii]MYZ43099.1 2-C-methyl-D-erythritol 4-phosphate cytidylyltransferase [Achromobacter aestuarii]
MSQSIICIVPAAGVGARAQRAQGDASPKQYRGLAGQPMLRHAVQALLADPRVSEVRVAVSPDDGWAADALAGLDRCVIRPCGGPTRAATVSRALADAALADEAWVLVHDAARPGLPADALARLIDACVHDPVGGLLAMPVPDTVKRAATSAVVQAPMNACPTQVAAGENIVTRSPAEVSPLRVASTLAREGLWLAQTPQMFRAGMLQSALHAADRAGVVVTDEASAIEAAGYAPQLVLGSARNFKVTWPDDFELMEKWL